MKRKLEMLLQEFQKTGDSEDIFSFFESVVASIHQDTVQNKSPSKETEQNNRTLAKQQKKDKTMALRPVDSIQKRMMKTSSSHTVVFGTESSEQQRVNPKNVQNEGAFYKKDTPQSPHTQEQNDFNAYEKSKILGKGGMGTVWQVKDTKLNRVMALKVMNEQFLFNDEAREEFVEEAQISSQLQHPGIVPIYELNSLPDGNMYFTMKEVQGRTLGAVIKSVHRASIDGVWRSADDGWNLRRLINAFHSVCETIAYAHEKKVIHRDLKPSNIMIGTFGEVLVVDWGIAKILPQRKTSMSPIKPVETNRSQIGVSEEEGTVVGTPRYMSPEQAWGRIDSIDACSDVYSLGMILYEILIGKVPYTGSTIDVLKSKRKAHTHSLRPSVRRQKNIDSTEDVLVQHSVQSESDAYVVEPHLPLPNELVSACEKALRYEREERYQSVSEFAHAIQSWLEGVQRREKALGIIEKTQEIDQKIEHLKREAKASWKKANQLIVVNDVGATNGWECWVQSEKNAEMIEELEAEVQQLLQGALIYDPELIEIHRKLIQLEYVGFIEALLRADKRIQKKIERRIDIHLENLPIEETNRWKSRKEKDMGSLNLLRKRRGVFVGRVHQKSEIQNLLAQTSVLSLVGTAGVGKTHLVLETLSEWMELQKREAYFCDVTTAKDFLGLVQIIAKTLNIKLGAQDPVSKIVSELSVKGITLLVLDNIEQVVQDAARLVQSLLEPLESLKIIVTSRIKMGIGQETLFRLNPMSLLEGIELFVQRAQKVQPEFSLSVKNRELIGGIVQRLDMLPLAIELAAARVSMLSVEEIGSRLSQRFDLLRGRVRDHQKRALRGALDWSWDLLSDFGRVALVQCSTFCGGFDLHAAESVLNLRDFEGAPSIIDILEALYDDNLLLKERQEDGRFRYRMLASIHEYAIEKGEEQIIKMYAKDSIFRHAQYFSEWYKKTEVQLPNFSSSVFLELDNLIFGTQNGKSKDAFLCCQAAMKYFRLNGPMDRGIELSSLYLQRKDLTDETRLPVILDRIVCLRISGALNQAKEEMKKASMEFRLSSEKHKQAGSDVRATVSSSLEAFADMNQELREVFIEDVEQRVVEKKGETSGEILLEDGLLALEQSEYETAISLFTQSLERFRNQSNQVGAGRALHNLGRVFREKGESKTALTFFMDALPRIQISKVRNDEACLLGDIGVVYSKIGQTAESISFYKRSILLSQQCGDRNQESITLGNLGSLYNDLGGIEQGKQFLEDAISIARTIGNKKIEGINLGNLGLLYRKLGQYEESIRLYQQALRIYHEIGNKRREGLINGYIGTLYQNLGNYEACIAHYKKTIRIAQEIGSIDLEGWYLGSLGSAYRNIGLFEESLQHYNRALSFVNATKNKKSEAITLGNIGDLMYEWNRYEEAESYLLRAIAICDDLEPIAAGAFRGSLGMVYANQNKIEEGLALLAIGEEQVSINREEYAKLLCKKGIVLLKDKQFLASKKILEIVQDIFAELNPSEQSELSKLVAEFTARFDSEFSYPYS